MWVRLSSENLSRRHFHNGCRDTNGLGKGNSLTKGCRRIPICGEEKRLSEVRGNAQGADGKRVWFRWNSQLGWFSGCRQGAGHLWKAKRKKLGMQSGQSTDCNCLGLDIQELRTWRLKQGQIVQNELGCKRNNFWSNGKKCQKCTKVNLMPVNFGKSVRGWTWVVYRKG